MKLKRIKYISSFAKELSREEIDKLVADAAAHNKEKEITGFLATSGNMFFQVLEGPREAVDELYLKILGDERHTNVMLLREEQVPDRRIFPDWSMKLVDLSSTSVARLAPLQAILETIFLQHRSIGNLSAALERSIWEELAKKL